MGWKPNLKLSNQNFSNTYQNRQDHGLTAYMKVKKMNQRIGKKNGGKRLKGRKLQGLPLHWFFTNDSTTTKTSFVTIESTMVSKS
jgi:hypothetical protein